MCTRTLITKQRGYVGFFSVIHDALFARQKRQSAARNNVQIGAGPIVVWNQHLHQPIADGLNLHCNVFVQVKQWL